MKIIRMWNSHEKNVYIAMNNRVKKFKIKHPYLHYIGNKLFNVIDKYFSIILLVESIIALSLFLYTLQRFINKFFYEYRDGLMSIVTASSIILPIQFSKLLEYVKNHDGWKIFVCILLCIASGILFFVLNNGYQIIGKLLKIIYDNLSKT